jgi:hypothetical protein
VLQTVSSVWNPIESEFKPFLERLTSSITQITWQVSLASQYAGQEAKMLLEYESKEKSSFRSSTLDRLKRSAHQQEEARQGRINQTKRENALLKIKFERTCPLLTT